MQRNSKFLYLWPHVEKAETVIGTTSNRTGRTFRALAAWALLLLYLTGNTGTDLFHQLFHNKSSQVLHTPAQERDVCHRAIYHFGKDPKHNSHLAVRERADHCHLLVHPDQLTLQDLHAEKISSCPTFHERLAVRYIPAPSTLLPSRAPPV